MTKNRENDKIFDNVNGSQQKLPYFMKRETGKGGREMLFYMDTLLSKTVFRSITFPFYKKHEGLFVFQNNFIIPAMKS